MEHNDNIVSNSFNMYTETCIRQNLYEIPICLYQNIWLVLTKKEKNLCKITPNSCKDL
jgi:hypothetical protein